MLQLLLHRLLQLSLAIVSEDRCLPLLFHVIQLRLLARSFRRGTLGILDALRHGGSQILLHREILSDFLEESLLIQVDLVDEAALHVERNSALVQFVSKMPVSLQQLEATELPLVLRRPRQHLLIVSERAALLTLLRDKPLSWVVRARVTTDRRVLVVIEIILTDVLFDCAHEIAPLFPERLLHTSITILSRNV